MVRLTDRTDMTSDVYRGRKTTIQQQLIGGEHRGTIEEKDALSKVVLQKREGK